MPSPTSLLAHILPAHTALFDQLTADFTEPDWSHRLAETSSPYWLLGHMTYCRLVMLKLAAEPDAPELESWRPYFGRGSKPTADHPIPLHDLRARFTHAGSRLTQLLASHTPDHLDSPAFREFPGNSRTNGQALQFLAFHEGYHIGQIGLLARLLGRTGIGR